MALTKVSRTGRKTPRNIVEMLGFALLDSNRRVEWSASGDPAPGPRGKLRLPILHQKGLRLNPSRTSYSLCRLNRLEILPPKPRTVRYFFAAASYFSPPTRRSARRSSTARVQTTKPTFLARTAKCGKRTSTPLEGTSGTPGTTSRPIVEHGGRRWMDGTSCWSCSLTGSSRRSARHSSGWCRRPVSAAVPWGDRCGIRCSSTRGGTYPRRASTRMRS